MRTTRIMATRRGVITTAGTALGALAAGSASARDGQHDRASTVVLVHGAWHGGWYFEFLRQHLEIAGYTVIAPSLPGCGLNARFPPSYFINPRPASFQTDPSPVRNVTAADYINFVCGLIRSVTARTGRPVLLVGHSLAGIVLNGVGERLGRRYISALVYLSALLPKNQTPVNFYIGLPSQSDSGVLPLLRADPARVGALRIDPNSSDPSYVAAIKHAFYADLPRALFLATINDVVPDEPALPLAESLTITRARWGTIPRYYIHSTQDFVIRPETQNLMIADADEFTPSNKTTVIPIAAGHVSFLSKPQKVSEILLHVLDQNEFY